MREPIANIKTYLVERNNNPMPSHWRAMGEDIPGKSNGLGMILRICSTRYAMRVSWNELKRFKYMGAPRV